MVRLNGVRPDRITYKQWCAQQFGPSDAVLIRYSLVVTDQGLRVGLYQGEGRWAFSLTTANFENPEDAFAFKMRFG
jgi:alpha-L-fucosidase